MGIGIRSQPPSNISPPLSLKHRGLISALLAYPTGWKNRKNAPNILKQIFSKMWKAVALDLDERKQNNLLLALNAYAEGVYPEKILYFLDYLDKTIFGKAMRGLFLDSYHFARRNAYCSGIEENEMFLRAVNTDDYILVNNRYLLEMKEKYVLDLKSGRIGSFSDLRQWELKKAAKQGIRNYQIIDADQNFDKGFSLKNGNRFLSKMDIDALNLEALKEIREAVEKKLNLMLDLICLEYWKNRRKSSLPPYFFPTGF